MLHRHFRQVTVHSGIKPQSRPVLLIGNHFSWWDGFIACYINQVVLRKKLHIMMLEEQLESRLFLNKAGAYSIRKGSRDALVSLDYTTRLLTGPENLVVIYPQGEFESIYRFPVTFEKGIETVIRRASPGFRLMFYAALIDYFSHRKPKLSIYLAEYEGSPVNSSEDLQIAYNHFLQDCIARQKTE
jgi:hypothetical protein